MSEGLPTLRERQRSQTRAEIVRRAFDLFTDHGFESVSVEMICAAAGISRATFFNYFPQKELILREAAAARIEKLKLFLAEMATDGHPVILDDLVDNLVQLCEANARLSINSKRLVLEALFGASSQGLILSARELAIGALAEIIDRMARKSTAAPRLVAETIFSIYIASSLEWLMREDVPQSWLADTVRSRLELVMKGIS